MRFILDLPETRPLSLAEAAACDESLRKSGWRSLWYRGQEPEWFSLRGHPVVVYRGHETLGDDMAVLLWKHEGAVHELAIDGDVPLDEAEETAPPPAGCVQLALF